MNIHEENLRNSIYAAEEAFYNLVQVARSDRTLDGLDAMEINELYRMSSELLAVVAQFETYIANRTGSMDTA